SAADPRRRARAGRRQPKIPAWHSRLRRFFDSVPRFRCAPSPHLRGEGWGEGGFPSAQSLEIPLTRRAPQARLPACASTSPGARGEVELAPTQAPRHTQEERSYDSRRALEARERFVDLEAARLGFFALLALAFDYVLRRARDEVGIGELGVDAGDVGFNARHFLLEARFLGGEIDHPLERQRRHLPAHDALPPPPP